MRTFFVSLGFLSYTLCAHAPSQEDLSTCEGVSPMDSTGSEGVALLSKAITCDAELIKLRPWNFDLATDVADAYATLSLCVDEISYTGIFTMIEVANPMNRNAFFEHSVFEALSKNRATLASSLLTCFSTYPLPITVFQKLRNSECKDTLPFLMHGWRYRYPATTNPLDIMDEIVESCIFFKDHPLLFAFLKVCPIVSAGTIKAFEDAVIAKDNKTASCIFQSGVLGWCSMYGRMSQGLAQFRQSMRAKAHDLVLKGSALQLHSHVGEIEIPFIVQLMTKAVHQPRSFVYLINAYGDSMLKGEALAVYKAACVAGHPDVFRHAFKVVSKLNYEIPLVFHALRSGVRLDPTKVIKLAVSLNYKPCRHEVANCIETRLKDRHIPALLMKTWPEYLIMSEVFNMFPRFIATGTKQTVLAALGLCKNMHLFTLQRRLVFSLIGETNHRGSALHNLVFIRNDPELLRAVLETLDPRLFGSCGYPSIEYHMVNLNEYFVQSFLFSLSEIVMARTLRSINHLRDINLAMKEPSGAESDSIKPDSILVQTYMRDGGSWEEILLLATKHQAQEDIIRHALEVEGADPFIVDPDSKVALLDTPEISEEAKALITRAQIRALAKNRKLAMLWMKLPVRDLAFILAEKYRLFAIDAHRKVFNHNAF